MSCSSGSYHFLGNLRTNAIFPAFEHLQFFPCCSFILFFCHTWIIRNRIFNNFDVLLVVTVNATILLCSIHDLACPTLIKNMSHINFPFDIFNAKLSNVNSGEKKKLPFYVIVTIIHLLK